MRANRFRFRIWLKKVKRMELMPDEHLYYDGTFHIDYDCTDVTDEIIPMQSTGLLDKNGKEIFEGDKILHKGYDSYGTGLPNDRYEIDVISEVFWDTGMLQWSLRELSPCQTEVIELVDADKPEVIGNVYENPELMEEGK